MMQTVSPRVISMLRSRRTDCWRNFIEIWRRETIGPLADVEGARGCESSRLI